MTVSQGSGTIQRLCRQAGVSRAGYYRHWQESAPRAHDTALQAVIQDVVRAHKQRCGYRYIMHVLKRHHGMIVNHKRVLRLMRQDNLLCLRHKPFVPTTTDSRHKWKIVPNLVRDLELTGLDQLWVADITYVRLQEQFAYLAVVIDAFSRLIVGWKMADHLRASLAMDALTMALAERRPVSGSLIHHSDRGVQYACGDYSSLLEQHGIAASMSRVGNPYDNAKAESFMKTLKTEEVDGRLYRDRREAEACIGTFIEQVYNTQRLHSALGYRPPSEFEALHRARLGLGVGDAARSGGLRAAHARPRLDLKTQAPDQ
jgi:transposase InsO family protein